MKENHTSEPSMSDYNFYKTLLNPEKASLKGTFMALVPIVKKDDADLFLSKSLYPVLLMGLEDLAIRIEQIQNETDERVKARFNACAYLAEYLMRNNPKYNPEKTKHLSTLYTKYAKKERIQRVLNGRKALLRSLFMRAAGAPKDFASQVKAFIEVLDKDMGLAKKIAKTIDVAALSEKEEFEEFWLKFINAMKEQAEIEGDEIESALEAKYPSAKK